LANLGSNRVKLDVFKKNRSDAAIKNWGSGIAFAGKGVYWVCDVDEL
jgi:hypothetical protein